jgi:glycosyltransferase involved in cell wall biosynthesis
VSAIPELITDEKTGRLVPPADPATLAKVLEKLIKDPKQRDRLGRASADNVRTNFATHPGLDHLAEKFRKVL